MPKKDEAQAEAELHNQENMLPRAQVIVVIATIGVILAIVNMDSNGISTALPKIGASLNAANTISWAGTSSLIATTVFSVLYGRLSDIFGRRPTFVVACLVFAGAELICGFAVDGPMLYVGRAITGMSGGGLGNLSMIIASDIIPLEQRGKYQGFCGAFIAVGNVIGPFIAAAFADSVTWRAFFWFLSPLGVICAVCAMFLLPPTKAPGPLMGNLVKIDWIGSFTSTTAIVLFLIPISGGGYYYAWDSALVISFLCIAFVSFVAFLVWEIKFANLPVIPLSMFKNRSVCALMAQAFLTGWAYQVCLYFLPLYYQNLRGYSAIVSASLLTPIIGVQAIVSILGGRYISNKKRYGGVIRLGNFCLLAGCALMIIFDQYTSPVAIVFILLLVGLGIGNSTQPTVVALQAHTKKSFRAVVISCRNFMRFLGAACGIAVSSEILEVTLRSALPAEYKSFAQSVYSLPTLNSSDEAAVGPAYAKAIRTVFITNAVVAAVSMSLCLLWRDHGLQRSDENAEGGYKSSQPQPLTSAAAESETTDVEKEAQGPESSAESDSIDKVEAESIDSRPSVSNEKVVTEEPKA